MVSEATLRTPAKDSEPMGPSLLQPVTRLQDMHPDKSYLPNLDEFRLEKWPTTLTELHNIFRDDQGSMDSNRVLWTTEHCMVHLGGHAPGKIPRPTLVLTLESTKDSVAFHLVSPHGRKIDDVQSTLDQILGLQDDSNYPSVMISHGVSFLTMPCPVSEDKLQSILQQVRNRKLDLQRMCFSPSQCRVLASAGSQTEIHFRSCEFEESASAAFADAYLEKPGPCKLLFDFTLPLHNDDLARVVNHSTCQSIHLREFVLDEELVQLLWSAQQLEEVGFSHCFFEDEKCEALVLQALQEQRGPQGLCLDLESGRFPFESADQWQSFCDALGKGHHLKSFTIDELGSGDFECGFLPPLAEALRTNQGLEDVVLRLTDRNALEMVSEVLLAVAQLPSLRSLQLTSKSAPSLDQEAKYLITEMAKALVLKNSCIEHMNLCDGSLADPLSWDETIAPKLEHHFIQKRLKPIQSMKSNPSRAAVLAASITQKTPLTTWLLLSGNLDLVASPP